jgi:signal transduction histidine kinase
VPAVVGWWDERRLERVLANLLTNAIKYSPDGGEILVRVDLEQGPTGPRSLLAVTDCGVGIPAADLPHVFERYRRGGNVGGIAGSGIGLFGSRRIVEQHGGTIEAASREGNGSTFTLRLPLGPEAKAT